MLVSCCLKFVGLGVKLFLGVTFCKMLMSKGVLWSLEGFLIFGDLFLVFWFYFVSLILLTGCVGVLIYPLDDILM